MESLISISGSEQSAFFFNLMEISVSTSSVRSSLRVFADRLSSRESPSTQSLKFLSCAISGYLLLIRSIMVFHPTTVIAKLKSPSVSEFKNLECIRFRRYSQVFFSSKYELKAFFDLNTRLLNLNLGINGFLGGIAISSFNKKVYIIYTIGRRQPYVGEGAEFPFSENK